MTVNKKIYKLQQKLILNLYNTIKAMYRIEYIMENNIKKINILCKKTKSIKNIMYLLYLHNSYYRTKIIIKNIYIIEDNINNNKLCKNIK